MTSNLENLQTLFDAASDLVQVTTTDGRLLYVNPAWCRALGYDRAAVVGSLMQALLQPEAADRYQQLCTLLQTQSMPSHLPVPFTLRTVTGNAIAVSGRMVYQAGAEPLPQIWSLWHMVQPAIEPAQPPMEHFQQVRHINDYLEQKVFERTAAFQESEARFRRLTENVPGMIFRYVTRADGTDAFTYVSPRCLDVFAVEATAVMQSSKVLWELVHPDDAPALRASMTASIQPGATIWSVEHRILTPTGHLKWIRTVARRTDQLAGDRIWDGFAEDITERKQAEAEVAKALAKERELHQMRSRFVTTVSHEFRTPLTVIQSASELLELSTESSEEIQEYYGQIYTAIDQMIRLLDDVLLTGKLESGTLKIQTNAIDLPAVCQAIVREFQLMHGKNYRFHYLCTGDIKPVLLDKDLLRQILNNLLSNAVKYSPEGSDIWLKLAHVPNQIILQVQDSGMGIPADVRAQVFDAFYRAENVGAIQGNGLGLAIAKQCVELQHGTIAVESEEGKGTTFTITFGVNAHQTTALTD